MITSVVLASFFALLSPACVASLSFSAPTSVSSLSHTASSTAFNFSITSYSGGVDVIFGSDFKDACVQWGISDCSKFVQDCLHAEGDEVSHKHSAVSHPNGKHRGFKQMRMQFDIADSDVTLSLPAYVLDLSNEQKLQTLQYLLHTSLYKCSFNDLRSIAVDHHIAVTDHALLLKSLSSHSCTCTCLVFTQDAMAADVLPSMDPTLPIN
ncbi:hypothetical protein BDP27DRAFT_1425588 [Rhodocollybia butyracea]|uniref:Uncharacterized protein n=1 Tax=Rhodocollybia butyracea TaxID=206335 RepID=A0A9P5PIU6_9AGAR|nr:hypothetical protein BDP27DRAFT_1425588 [Rhodocollybia butyracea]